MKIKISFSILITSLILNGCISEFNAQLPYEDLQILYVDGSIIERSTMTFYLNKSFSLDLASIPEENLNIYATLYIIASNGFKSQPATNMGRGAYSISIGELDDNLEYGIQIEYNGDIYQSTLSKPLSTPEIDSISWIQPEERGEVFFRISTHDDTGNAKFFLWSYIEDWEVTANFLTSVFFDTETSDFYELDTAPFYYCWRHFESNRFLIGSTESLKENRIINKQIYQISPEDHRFSVLYSVNVNQKAISKSAYEYYQNKIVLNNEMGGLFTPQPAEITGNITCLTDPSKKVMGYVEAVKNTTQKRIFVPRSDISRPYVGSSCTLVSSDSIINLINSIYPDSDNPFLTAYMFNYRPVVAGPIIDVSEIQWSMVYCTDCVAAGGSKKKPPFWPNNHE